MKNAVLTGLTLSAMASVASAQFPPIPVAPQSPPSSQIAPIPQVPGAQSAPQSPPSGFPSIPATPSTQTPSQALPFPVMPSQIPPAQNTPSQSTFPSQSSLQPPPMTNRGEPNFLPPKLLPPPQMRGSEQPKGFSEKKPTVGSDGLPIPKIDQPLARLENAKALGVIDVKYMNNNWQVMAGSTVFANFGTDWKSAEKVGLTLQSMQAGEHGKATRAEMLMTAWATIGQTRPQVGYMTMRGDAIRSFKGVLHTSLPMDLNTLHAEEVRGVWVVRDQQNILLNFGEEKQEAEQAVAVSIRYGFNRIGYIGGTDHPLLRYFYADPDSKVASNPGMNKTSPAMAAAFQEATLNRTGVEIPGHGLVGVKINIDPRKLDIRKDGAEYSLVSAGEVLGKFGRDEWTARDAMRIVQKLEPTSVVRIGSPGIQFFLKGSETPNRMPFGTIGSAYSFDRISQRITADEVIHLYDANGREFTSVKTQKDADAVKAAIKHYQLNRSCQVGNAPHSLTFFVRSN